MSADPVPAITEAAATGETAKIYADLRATLGVNVVNLIWRHIATIPGALAWAWGTAKPVYVSGRVAIEARRIRAEFSRPTRSRWPREVLSCAGVDARGEQSIRQILSSYNRSNAMNLAALSALVRRIDGAPAASEPAPDLVQTPQDTARDMPITGVLPTLLTLAEVSTDTAALIRRINLLGDRAEGRITASMYRHLAHWPGYLALSYVQLLPMAADGRLEMMIDQAVDLGERAGARLQSGMADLPPPASGGEVRRAATDFIQHAISRMVPIAALLQANMPE